MATVLLLVDPSVRRCDDAMPEDAEFVQTHCQGIDGFYGASSVERLPVEKAIVAQVRRFKSTKIKQRRSL